ncbi:hypothetical protein K466DRAFT_308710 [Polyporus arcularius HHB13444]|uniref:Uncharacterized protein n=1 Tax=Polyporus arcularius HHB13444 TaxID=1314778 RepID=A0A5C3P8Q7_9APHY|nr:hypothetical protein K466DRAFT_308710 [Polyporus arcularius HHB13444]
MRTRRACLSGTLAEIRGATRRSLQALLSSPARDTTSLRLNAHASQARALFRRGTQRISIRHERLTCGRTISTKPRQAGKTRSVSMAGSAAHRDHGRMMTATRPFRTRCGGEPSEATRRSPWRIHVYALPPCPGISTLRVALITVVSLDSSWLESGEEECMCRMDRRGG